MTARSAALFFGLIFIVIGILGFFENPIVGESQNAIFHADNLHNAVHISSGILFLLVAIVAPSATAGFMLLFGIVYLVIGVLGFLNVGADGMAKVLGLLH